MSAVSKAGRRRRTAADMARLERGEAAAPKPTFTIPLRPHVSSELADGATLSKVLHQEYATRLLESMGATPTSKNLELIRKYAPIDSNALKVSARKTGHSKDEVEVTTPDVVYDYKVQHMGCRAKPHEMVTMGIMQGRMEKDASTNVDNCFTMMEDAAEEHLEKQLQGKAAGDFVRKSRQFVFPYSLKEKPPAGVKELLKSLNMGMKQPASSAELLAKSTRLARKSSASASASVSTRPPLSIPSEERAARTSTASNSNRASAAPTSTSACRTPHPFLNCSTDAAAQPPPRTLQLKTFSGVRTRREREGKLRRSPTREQPSSDVSGVGRERTDAGDSDEREKDEAARELARELSQGFTVEVKDVISLQESFGVMLLDWKAKDISDADLHSAVSEHDFLNTLRELGSALTVGLCRRFVQFLYNAHLLELPAECEEQEQLAFHIHRDYGVMCTKYRKSNAHLFFTLPITLMSLRSLVESLFTSRFPLWVATMEGKQALRKMDGTIMSMLDPHAYYTELSLFVSTSAAIHILQGAFRKARRGIPERMYNTSPLTRTVLGEPAAPETRRLLHSEARAKTKLAGGFATSKAAGSGSRGEGGAGEASQSQRAAHGILSDGHRAELYKLSTKLQSTRNALPDKRYK